MPALSVFSREFSDENFSAGHSCMQLPMLTCIGTSRLQSRLQPDLVIVTSAPSILGLQQHACWANWPLRQHIALPLDSWRLSRQLDTVTFSLGGKNANINRYNCTKYTHNTPTHDAGEASAAGLQIRTRRNIDDMLKEMMRVKLLLQGLGPDQKQNR